MRNSITLSATLAVALSACGSSQDTDTTTTPVSEQPAPEAAAPPEATPETAPEATPPGESTAQPADTGAAQPSPGVSATPQLNDAQIAAFLSAANKAEIEAAQIEKKSGKNAEAKKLAAMILKDHQAAEKQASGLMAKAGLQPDESGDDIQALKSKSQAAIDQLKSLKGAELDKAYVDSQVTMHQDVIDAIDQRILPAVQNAELKSFITGVRPKLQAHLDHAKALQGKLMGGGG